MFRSTVRTSYWYNAGSLFIIIVNQPTWRRKPQHSCDQTRAASGQVRRLARGGRSYACAIQPGSLIDWKAVEWLPWFGVDQPSPARAWATHRPLIFTGFLEVQLIVRFQWWRRECGRCFVWGSREINKLLQNRQEEAGWSEEINADTKHVIGFIFDLKLTAQLFSFRIQKYKDNFVLRLEN